MPFQPWQCPDDLALAIRAGARRIAALNKLRTQTKNQLHAAEQTATTPDFLIAELLQSIAQFNAHIEALRQHVLDLIATDEKLQESLELLISVTGIAHTPAPFNSSSSVNKKPRLSKVGNRYLRIALYIPALSATRHDPDAGVYYRTSSPTGASKSSRPSVPSCASS